jgi:Zn-dependent protease/predicted transcriptional regulator
MMFGRGWHLFSYRGIAVKVDFSWFFIALLITWSLASGLFPQMRPDLAPMTYWIMGVVGALGLFASVLIHEFSHALMALRHNIPIRGITLFIFGGVAEMGDEPPTAKAEFLVAVVGPITSVVLGLIFILLQVAPLREIMPPAISGVVYYLGFINILLAVFNSIPAFPLDGGRILRSALWHWKGDLKWATRISSSIGAGFGLFLILVGLVQLFAGNLIGGIWMGLIGMFLRNAATMSYQQVLLRKSLEGETVSRFMNSSPITVTPNLPLSQLVDDYVYRYHHKMYPVVDDGRLVGCVTTRQIKDVPREEWPWKTVADVADRCGTDNTVRPDTDAMKALTKMNRNGSSRLMVLDGDYLAGIISLKDLLRFLALKVELEDESELQIPQA